MSSEKVKSGIPCTRTVQGILKERKKFLENNRE
jgi:hypothetical protein